MHGFSVSHLWYACKNYIYKEKQAMARKYDEIKWLAQATAQDLSAVDEKNKNGKGE